MVPCVIHIVKKPRVSLTAALDTKQLYVNLARKSPGFVRESLQHYSPSCYSCTYLLSIVRAAIFREQRGTNRLDLTFFQALAFLYATSCNRILEGGHAPVLMRSVKLLYIAKSNLI